MKRTSCLLTLLLAFAANNASAITRYVDVNSTNPVPPYTNWATAANVIQDAVDAADPGDEVLVTNGVYATGGRAVYGTMTNRVAVDKPLTLLSVNGPEFTIIKGHKVPPYDIDDGAIRCVYLTNGASLSGFTLTNGATRASGNDLRERRGGGLWCESTNAWVTNCTLTGNSAIYGGGSVFGTLNNCLLTNNSATHGAGSFHSALNNCTLTRNLGGIGGGSNGGILNNCLLTNNSGSYGGGSSGGTLNNCTLTGNSASGSGGGAASSILNNCVISDNSAGRSGGGAVGCTLNNCLLTRNSAVRVGGGVYSGTLNNCTLTRNSADSGGGSSAATLNNCIVYFNTAFISGDNYGSDTLNHCCTSPLPFDGTGNIDVDPQMASASHLSVNSPCRAAGSVTYAMGTDIDGELWASPPSIGCDEYWMGSVTGALDVALEVSYTNVAVGFAVDFQAVIEGRLSESQWDFGDGTVVSNRPYASHTWQAPGVYMVYLWAFNDEYPAGVSTSVAVHVSQKEHFVALNSGNPVPPYNSWATAATNIQDAVDAAWLPGALVLVSNGVYQSGARAVYGVSNRLAVTKPLTLLSVNGPEFTLIKGYQVPDTTNGDAAIRCVYLTNGAVLSGFTLTNGATQSTGDVGTNRSGGGVWCEMANAVVTNCVLTGNSGGGAYNGILSDCTFSNNWAGLGGGASYGRLTNCTLTGNSADYGGGAYHCTVVDCAFWSNSASRGGGAYSGELDECTLTGNSASYQGGGAHSVRLNNCTLTGNSANEGGGAYDSTLRICTITDNSAHDGGGAYDSALKNCTITGNWAADQGGGAHSSTLHNSIVYYNSAGLSGDNYHGGTLEYCCTSPLPEDGAGNIDFEPLLASTSHLSVGSPCIGRGSPDYVSGVDVDGEPWANPPSIGCDEYWIGSVTGALSVAIEASYTNVAVGFAVDFRTEIEGPLSESHWDFGDGTLVSNQPHASHAWTVAGDYPVELRAYNESWPGGVSATVTVQVVESPMHYVAVNSTNPTSPYDSWSTAATNIQDAVDAAWLPGALVLVSNGVYQTGARAVYGMSNRVAVTKPLALLSVNGPEFTLIEGYQVPGMTNGDAAIRCVYLTNGTVLSGFTLTNGATQSTGDAGRNRSGGGVWCEPGNAVVTNCTLTGNRASYYGGGAYYGTLNGCVFTGNSASHYGGGAYCSTLNDCTLVGNSVFYWGGGAHAGTLNSCLLMNNSASAGDATYSSTLNNCMLKGNSASAGGGAYFGTLNNCIISENSANQEGGGVSYGTLTGCTLTGNSAGSGGGAYNGTLNNCIVYYNSASNGPNSYDSMYDYCCTTPLPGGTGNFTNAPLFVNTNGWTNLRLQSNSPCINAGNNADVTGSTDLDGRPRIVSGTVDMGAYEFQGPGFSEFIGWLAQYDLPTDGSADFAHSDADPHNNWQEWKTWTDPTDELSFLRMLNPEPGTNGAVVSWQSEAGHSYFVERAGDSAGSFSVIQSNLTGQTGVTSFTDTNAVGDGPFLYRVGVPE